MVAGLAPRLIDRPLRVLLALALLVPALAALPTTAEPAGPRALVDPAVSAATGTVSVIVSGVHGATTAVEEAVEDAGGVISRVLPIVDGVSAEVPADAVDDIADRAGVRAITLDGSVRVQGTVDQSNLASTYPKSVRATKMWNAGYTGKGVTVALIDTGVADVPDLAGRVLPVYDDVEGTWSPCLNLTGEAGCSDSYGHGTFMAGIIAGNGAASSGQYIGIAPEANLVSIKIAGRDGSSDVSSVLAAIQWTVSFKDRYGIRVLNLSLGTNGKGSYRSDPLNYAVQRAWHSGIAVIVAASNLGPEPGTISKPGDDPWVVTVGAVDERATSGIGNDSLPNFSAQGPTAADGLAKPDLVAPGARIVSLNAPGSAIADAFPTSVIAGHYRSGSGTSMATAVASGAAALMVEAKPDIVPDRLKYALMSTARPVASDNPMAVGKGIPDIYEAAFAAPAGVANQGLSRSSGLGSLDASRGDVFVAADDPLLTLVNGTLTLQLLLWDPLSYTTGEWSGSKWYGSKWYGSKWYGSKWYGSKWYGSKWYGSKWYGEEDASTDYGTPLPGGGWLGAWD